MNEMKKQVPVWLWDLLEDFFERQLKYHIQNRLWNRLAEVFF